MCIFVLLRMRFYFEKWNELSSSSKLWEGIALLECNNTFALCKTYRLLHDQGIKLADQCIKPKSLLCMNGLLVDRPKIIDYRKIENSRILVNVMDSHQLHFFIKSRFQILIGNQD